MTNEQMIDTIQLLDVVALAENLPKQNLRRGEVGAVVECYPNDAYEVEFVAQDGYTYALVTVPGGQLIPLRQKRDHLDVVTEPAAF
ncbi:hypothetical protein MNBD_CHLOROFLEXI01-4089 [hydrothermal vent metagenome]|uniref:DUF4926 domain-containing protein n=2 Tax=hydrothermal vent metagenome TaxID=652676 RepID=A0A3B0VN30_9ZZZZ